jgi:hypothetical protein
MLRSVELHQLRLNADSQISDQGRARDTFPLAISVNLTIHELRCSVDMFTEIG